MPRARSTYRRRVRVDNVPRTLALQHKLDKKSVSVGIHAGVRAKLLMIAIVNEFGLKIKVTPKMRSYLAATGLPLKKETKDINIPERSFIRGAFNKYRSKINTLARKGVEDIVLNSQEPRNILTRIGITVQGLVREYMTDLKEPPNHPYTLEKKSPKTNPLINTGELRRAVTYKVNDVMVDEEGGNV